MVRHNFETFSLLGLNANISSHHHTTYTRRFIPYPFASLVSGSLHRVKHTTSLAFRAMLALNLVRRSLLSIRT
jgi:hypothetical protein